MSPIIWLYGTEGTPEASKIPGAVHIRPIDGLRVVGHVIESLLGVTRHGRRTYGRSMTDEPRVLTSIGWGWFTLLLVPYIAISSLMGLSNAARYDFYALFIWLSSPLADVFFIAGSAFALWLGLLKSESYSRIAMLAGMNFGVTAIVYLGSAVLALWPHGLAETPFNAINYGWPGILFAVVAPALVNCIRLYGSIQIDSRQKDSPAEAPLRAATVEPQATGTDRAAPPDSSQVF